MIIRPGIRRNLQSINSLLTRTKMIFTSNSYNGGIWLPKDVATLFQESYGATAVSAVTNPVGLIKDQHLGLALGPELVTNGGFDADASWTKGAGWTIAGGKATHAPGAGSDIEQGTVSLVSGKAYKITFDVVAVRVTGTLYIWDGGAYTTIETNVTTGAKTAVIIATANTTLKIRLSINTDADIDNVTCNLLDGNHSIQATAPARPTWQVDANGKYYISALGTDDCFTCATGGGGTTGFFYCTAIQPTGGAGTTRILWSDVSGATGYAVYLSAANKITVQASDGVGTTTKASTATVDVGTKYLLTIWDDGTNLNVQINSAAAETTGRPVVAAGTAGFTRFKTNGAALNFFIGNEYASVYFKNTGLTAAERAAVQALVAACAGL